MSWQFINVGPLIRLGLDEDRCWCWHVYARRGRRKRIKDVAHLAALILEQGNVEETLRALEDKAPLELPEPPPEARGLADKLLVARALGGAPGHLRAVEYRVIRIRHLDIGIQVNREEPW